MDRLAAIKLVLNQFQDCFLVAIIESAWNEFGSLAFHEFFRQVELSCINLRFGGVLKNLAGGPHLSGIAQDDQNKSSAQRAQGNDSLFAEEHDTANPETTFTAQRLPENAKGLFCHRPVW